MFSGLNRTTTCVRNSVIDCDDAQVISRSEDLLSSSFFLADGCVDYEIPEEPDNAGDSGKQQWLCSCCVRVSILCAWDDVERERGICK